MAKKSTKQAAVIVKEQPSRLVLALRKIEYAQHHIEWQMDSFMSIQNRIENRLDNLKSDIASRFKYAAAGTDSPTYVAERVSHEITWGIANMDLDGLQRAAQDVEKAKQYLTMAVTEFEMLQVSLGIVYLDIKEDGSYGTRI